MAHAADQGADPAVAAGGEAQVHFNVDDLRTAEGKLFGAASDSESRQSLVRLRLKHWNDGQLDNDTWPKQEMKYVQVGQGQLPDSGRLRLGGDGKGATYTRCDYAPPAAPPSIAADRRFRQILATPGIFTGGWLPDGVNGQGERDFRLQGEGFSARLACAAVPRFDTISGWVLANWRPKTAQRVAPAGSVYWFDRLEGDAGELAAWVASGLWGDNPDRQRRAEGFNRAWLANWKGKQ